jgi:hypothetical protein
MSLNIVDKIETLDLIPYEQGQAGFSLRQACHRFI